MKKYCNRIGLARIRLQATLAAACCPSLVRQPIPLFLRAACVLGLLAIGAAACTGSNSLVCGAGTAQQGDQCVPVGGDAGLSDGPLADADLDVVPDADAEDVPPPCAKTGKCPKGAMVTVQWPKEKGGSYQIDPHKTTIAEYETFLSDVRAGLVPKQVADHCDWNETYEKGEACVKDVPTAGADVCGHTDEAEKAASPVYCVDNCDAKAYCEWAGKRLCGDATLESIAQANVESEIFRACTGGTDDYDAGGKACGYCRPECPNHQPGVYGIGGSMLEWTSFCFLTTECVSLEAGVADWCCNVVEDFALCGVGIVAPSSASGVVSFRCCK